METTLKLVGTRLGHLRQYANRDDSCVTSESCRIFTTQKAYTVTHWYTYIIQSCTYWHIEYWTCARSSVWPLSPLWQLHLSCTWNNPSLEEVEAAEWTCFSGSFLDGEAYSKLQTLYLVLHGSSQHMTLRSHWDGCHQQSKYLQGVENFCCERRIAVLLLAKVQHLPLLRTFHTQVSSGLNISRNLRYWGVWWKQIVSIVAKISSVVLREDVTWTATSTAQREVGTFRGWIATSEATATAAQLLHHFSSFLCTSKPPARAK